MAGPEEIGRIRRVDSRKVWVECTDQIVPASLRGLLKGGPRRNTQVVAVGDQVRILRSERSEARVEEIFPRRNWISRADPGDPRRELVIASNLDRLAVVVCVDRPRLNLRGLDRLLLLGEANGIPSVIILNKVDLWSGAGTPQDALGVDLYDSLGYSVFPVSARTGQGCAALRGTLQGGISLLLGPSGAGKSSLLNTLFPGLELPTQPVSRATAKGVHTTTRVEWISLPEGGALLDSPGIRSVQPWGLTNENLADFFPEFRRIPPCQFRNCRRREEPGCRAHEALAEGMIRESRYQSYLRILATLTSGGSWTSLVEADE